MAALLFSAAGAAAGAAGSEKLRHDRDISRSIGTLLRHISSLIRSTGMDVYRLSSELKRTECLSGLGFIRKLPERFEPETDYHSLWHDAVDGESYKSDEKRILYDLGDELGSSDIAGQLAAIDRLEQEIADIEAARTEDLNKKGRLYRSVGTLFGVMAGILII